MPRLLNGAAGGDTRDAMRVGLLLKHHKAEAADIARALLAVLAERGMEAWVASAPGLSLEGTRAVHVPDEQLAECGLLVVLGGDGTLLRGAELVADAGVPIFGVNLGNLGFLTSFSKEQAVASFAQALDGKLVIEQRMRLHVMLGRPGREPLARFACNDVVVSQGGVARLVDFEAFLDGQAISTYRADGPSSPRRPARRRTTSRRAGRS